VFGGKKSTLQRSELPAAAALRCGAIISAPRRIFTAWTLIRTAKFSKATVLKDLLAIKITGPFGEVFSQRCPNLVFWLIIADTNTNNKLSVSKSSFRT